MEPELIVNDQDGARQFDLRERPRISGYIPASICTSEVHKRVAALGSQQEYFFLTSAANPAATEVIEKHSEELTNAKYGKNSDHTVRFDLDHVRVYRAALDHVLKLHTLDVLSYPLITRSGSQSWYHAAAAYLPVVHIVPVEEAAAFHHMFDLLHSEEAYEFIKKKQQPMNYQLGSIDCLRASGVPPLKLDDLVWRTTGANAKEALNFLTQWRFHHEPHPPSRRFDED